MKSILLPAVIFGAVLLAGCDEEQVLYETESKEEIPEAPGVPADMEQAHEAAASRPATSETASTRPTTRAAGSLPAPEQSAFEVQELEEPVQRTTLAGLSIPIPERYVSEPVESGMRLAQFRVPREGMAEDGEFVVYYFGPGQGGSAMDNARRWFRQFQAPMEDGGPVALFQQAKHDGLTVTRLMLEGTWTPPNMPGMAQAGEAREDYAMDAVTIEGGPEGSVFLRLTGERRLVRVEGEVMENIAATVKAAEGE